MNQGLMNQGLMNQGLMNQTPTNWILMQNSRQTLGKIIRYFKAKTSKLVHDKGDSHFQWQRNYHEHIIRNEADINRIRQYICDNPVKWETDDENPNGWATKCALRFPRFLDKLENICHHPARHRILKLNRVSEWASAR